MALAVAGVLSNGKFQSGKGGHPVHHFTAPFLDFTQANWRCTSVVGHVFNTDFAPGSDSWQQDPELLYGAPLTQKPAGKDMRKHIRDQMKGADYVVLALDQDREGENIAFEILSVGEALMKPAPPGV